MTNLLTPFSVSILFLYISLLCILPMLSDFYFYMLIIEMSILLFLGFILLSFSNSFSSLIFFFLIQVFSSFNLLIGYTLSLESLIFLSLFLNTAFFPFISWFFNVSYRFPNLILCLVATIYNFPSLFVFYQFLNLSSSFLIISILLHFLAIASFIFVVNDLRLLLIVSSSASTAWFFLCLAYSSLYIFFFFYILYSLTLLLILSMIGPLSNYLLSSSFLSTNHRMVLFLLLSNLSAFPPFPLFLFNVAILYGFLFESSFLPFYESLLILLLNALIMVAYLKCYFNFLNLSFLSPTSIFLFLRLFLSYAKTFYILSISSYPSLLLFSVTPAIAIMSLDPDTLITVVSHADITAADTTSSSSSYLSSLWDWLFPGSAATATAISSTPANVTLSSLFTAKNAVWAIQQTALFSTQLAYFGLTLDPSGLLMLADALPVVNSVVDSLPVNLLPYEVNLFFSPGDHGRGVLGFLSNIPPSVIDSVVARSDPLFNGTLPSYPPLSPSDILLYGNKIVNLTPYK